MPTVLRIGPYRFHFYSDEGSEPPHIHIAKDPAECKFWLEPPVLASNHGFRPHEIRELEKLVFQNRDFLVEKYHDYHRKNR